MQIVGSVVWSLSRERAGGRPPDYLGLELFLEGVCPTDVQRGIEGCFSSRGSMYLWYDLILFVLLSKHE